MKEHHIPHAGLMKAHKMLTDSPGGCIEMANRINACVVLIPTVFVHDTTSTAFIDVLAH